MQKIDNWDNVEAKGMEDFKSLPIGAYELIIKEAVENHNEQSGKNTLKVAVDIATGEYKNYFQDKFDKNTGEDKKWDNNAIRYLSYEGENTSYFKGFITCVENSNPGYKWNWEESSLKDKKICGVFQYEEYKNQEGKKGVKVRLNKFRSLDKIKDIVVNDTVKLLDGSYVSYADYNKKNTSLQDKVNDLFGDSTEIVDEELPFII